MSRRSPLPDLSGRHRDPENRDRYHSRRGESDDYRRSADEEPRDSRRDRRVSERDTRRDYREDRRRRDDGDDRRRTKGDYNGRDDGRWTRDGSRDNQYTNRHDDDRSKREDYRDRGFRDDRSRRDRDGERGSSSRRSASPRHSRPRSRSTSAPLEDKTKPNFAPSGLLAAATNTVKNGDGTSTLLKYNEPPEARKPLVGWRLYVFKGDEQLGM
jgi:smad nuclear-interacting protein 1